MGNHVARGQGFISFGKPPWNHQVSRSCVLRCPDLLGTFEFFPQDLGVVLGEGQCKTSAYFMRPQELHLEPRDLALPPPNCGLEIETM